MTAAARAACVLALLVLAAPLADANQATATLRVTIGASNAGAVDLTLASEREPGRRWTATATRSRPAIFRALPSGRFRLDVGSPAVVPASLDLELAPGEIVTVAADRGAGGLPAIADRRFAAHGVAFQEREWQTLPAGSGLWGLLDSAAPLVITDRMDTGGLSLGTPARAGSRGASWARTTIRLDGMEVARGIDGPDTLAVMPDPVMFEAATVAAGMAGPELASPGATIALAPRRPPAIRHSALDVSFTAAGMTADNATPRAPSIARVESWASASLQSGGRIGQHAGLFLAGSASAVRASERGAETIASASVASAFGHVVVDAGVRTQMRAIGSVQRITRPSRVWPFRIGGLAERDLAVQAQVAWERHSPAGTRLAVALGYQRGGFAPAEALPSRVVIDRLIDGPVPDMAADATLSRPDVRVTVAPLGLRGHEMEFGASVATTAASRSAAQPFEVAELVGGRSARLWVSRAIPGPSSRSATHLAWYVKDRIQPRADLTVDLGLRLAHSRGSAEGATEAIGWTGVLPRLGVRWANRVATVFGGYGRYQDELPLALLAFGDPGEPARDVFRWDDRDGDRVVDTGEVDLLVARAGRAPGIASLDPGLSPPHTDEVVFGAERRLVEGMTIGATAVIRRERSLVRSVNVGVPLSGYQVRQIADQGEDWDSGSDDRLLAVFDRLPGSFGRDRYVLTNAGDEEALYEAVEVAWRWRTPRFWTLAGATAYRAEGRASTPGFRSGENDHGIVGERLENPNADSYSLGRLFFDRAYVLKWTGGFEAPRDVHVAFAARYQDGQPFSRLVIAEGLAQGPELVSAYFAGRTRFTFTATVDARVEKAFAVGGHRAAIRLDLYNLTNLGNEVEENPLTGPDFRKTTAVQPPLTLRLGFKVEF